jgi:hypothetical protein
MMGFLAMRVRGLQLAAPFDYGWGARQMQRAMVVATEAAGAAAGRADAAAFVSDLLASRYDVLYNRHPGKMVRDKARC